MCKIPCGVSSLYSLCKVHRHSEISQPNLFKMNPFGFYNSCTRSNIYQGTLTSVQFKPSEDNASHPEA